MVAPHHLRKIIPRRLDHNDGVAGKDMVKFQRGIRLGYEVVLVTKSNREVIILQHIAIEEHGVLLELEDAIVNTDRRRFHVRGVGYNGGTKMNCKIVNGEEDKVTFSMQRIATSLSPTLEVRIAFNNDGFNDAVFITD